MHSGPDLWRFRAYFQRASDYRGSRTARRLERPLDLEGPFSALRALPYAVQNRSGLHQRDQILDHPLIRGQSSHHRRSHAKRGVNPAEVVVHEEDRQHMPVIFNLL